MPCNLIKLVDVEEMNYLAAKGEGEVSEGPLSFAVLAVSCEAGTASAAPLPRSESPGPLRHCA